MLRVVPRTGICLVFLFSLLSISMKTDNRVTIENPCPKSWSKMTAAKDGRFCGSCEKVVIDFSKKTLPEINRYIANSTDKHACGRFRVQHVDQGNRWFSFLNTFENAMTKVRMHKVAIAVISGLLFLTGCNRALGGAYAISQKYKGKNDQHTAVDSTRIDQLY
jgi:hypothetical protein